MKRKRIVSLLLCLIMVFTLVGCSTAPAASETPDTEKKEAEVIEKVIEIPAEGAFNGSEEEVYYMNVFLPGAEFWKGCFDGFRAAADQLGVTVELTGAQDYDAAQQVESFEQILALDPAGILVCPIDPDSLTPSINKAIEMGIPVITFFNDSIGADHLGLFATSPEKEGELNAHKTAELIGGDGEIGIITRPQDNVARREAEFIKIVEEQYPDIEIVQSVFAEADTTKATQMTNAMIQANPNIEAVVAFSALEAIGAAQAKVELGADFAKVTHDTDPSVHDLIHDALIDAKIDQFIENKNAGYYLF